jgi:hypothetical protein
MSAFDPKRTSGERVAFDHERLNLTLAKGNRGPAALARAIISAYRIQTIIASLQIHRHNAIPADCQGD